MSRRFGLPTLTHRYLWRLALLLTLAMAGCASSDVTYIIQDGSTIVPVTGRFASVGEVLAADGITLGPKDVINPGSVAVADPDVPIVLDRAAEVTVINLNSVTNYHTQEETLGAFLAENGLVVPPGVRVLADGRPVSIELLDQTTLPDQIVFDPYKTVIITEGESRRSWRTTALTVGEALLETGIVVGALDRVIPPPETLLTPRLDVEIERAKPYVVRADGQTAEVAAGSTNVVDILVANGIVLGPLDYTRPPVGSTVRPGDIIEVVRVTETIEAEDVPIPFETVYEPAPDLEIDTIVPGGAGSPGVLQRRTRVRYENGVEVSRTPDGEIVTVAPVNAIIRYGTNIVMRTIDTPSGPVEYWRKVNMRVTSYTATSAGKKPGEPGYGITASGVQAGTGVIAVDPTVVPFKTYVYVPGYGVAFAGDTGGGIKGRFIDLGYDEDEYQSWRGYVDVYYLGPPPPADQIRWILP